MTITNKKRSIGQCDEVGMCTDGASSNYDDLEPDFCVRIKKAIECTCCCEIAGQLKQCRNGHLICSECWEKCPTCPVCRVKREDIRALTIEHVAAGIVVDCNNKTDGCHARMKYEDLANHQETCEFRRVTCCPIPGCECAVQINKKYELIKHIMRDHTVRIKERCGDNVRKIPKSMRISSDVHSNEMKMGWSLMEFKKRIFTLVSMQHKNRFTIEVTGVGNQPSFGRFFAEVAMLTRDRRTLTWKNEIYTTHERYKAKAKGRQLMYITLDVHDIFKSLAMPIPSEPDSGDMMLSWDLTVTHQPHTTDV